MPYSLIVVDLQKEFTAANNISTINACQNLLIQAMEDNATIIFLEFIGCGRTMETIYDLVDNYYNIYVLKKPSCDGSSYIKKLTASFEIPTMHFKVCGVNTDACVLDTVLGLSHSYPDAVVEVIESACNSDLDHNKAISIMEKKSNVVVTNRRIIIEHDTLRVANVN